jgi:hypothetical protein
MSGDNNTLVRFLDAVAYSRRHAVSEQSLTVKVDEWTGVVTVRELRELLEMCPARQEKAT